MSPAADLPELFRAEPRLAALKDRVRAEAGARDACPSRWCGVPAWREHLRPRLVRLVGMGRPDFHLALSSPAAHDAVLAFLKGCLPRCMHAGPCR
jgi:hypothetical protein